MAIDEQTSGFSDVDIEVEQASSDTRVIDEARYSHARRLRAIHNAHDRVIQVRNAVEQELIAGTITEFSARRYYRNAVEAFIIEMLPVIENQKIQLSEDYAHGVELGTVTVHPPSDLVELARENIGRMPAGARVPEPVSSEIHGLKTILDLPSPLRQRFSISIQDGRRGARVVSREVTEEIPRPVLDKAVQLAMKALEDAEMGLNIGSKRPRNSVSSDGKWPWEQDITLPHEVRDAVETGQISRERLLELIEEESEGDDESK